MTHLLINLVEKVIQAYKVDKSRIYLTGMSMGGYGSIALANKRPDLFAAMISVCGGADFDNFENLSDSIQNHNGTQYCTMKLRGLMELLCL